MTPNLVLANGLQTTLANNLSSSSTSIIIASSSGFPAIGAGQVLPLTIISASSSTTFEIVYATAISGTTLTVMRAQEGTPAGTFSVGDYIECAPTAQTVGITGIQTLIATANMTVTPTFMKTVVLSPSLTSAITITVNAGTILGQKVIVYGSASAYTVNIVPSVTSGSPYFAFVDGSKGYAWSLAGTFTGAYIELTWDGTNWSVDTAGWRVANAAAQPNQVTIKSQVMLNNGVLTNVDCNTLVTPGQYLLITPTNWAPTGTTSGLLLVVRINNEILQITSGFSNSSIWWRSSQYVTDTGFPAGVPWNQLYSSNSLFMNPTVYSNGNITPQIKNRVANTVYTNTTGKLMMLVLCASTPASTNDGGAATIRLLVNGNIIAAQYIGGTSSTIMSANFYTIIPIGATYEFIYSIGLSNTPIQLFWTEIV